MFLIIFDLRKLFYTVQEVKIQFGIIIMVLFREGKKIYRLVYIRRYYVGIVFFFIVCCVQFDFIFLGFFSIRDLQTFRNRVRYFWRTVCCFIFGISRIKFILLKKNKNRINIFYNFLFEKLFYKLVDGIDNIYFEYFFLN